MDKKIELLRKHLLQLFDECYEITSQKGEDVRVRDRDNDTFFEMINFGSLDFMKENTMRFILIEYIKERGQEEVISIDELVKLRKIKQMVDGIEEAQKRGIKW